MKILLKHMLVLAGLFGCATPSHKIVLNETVWVHGIDEKPIKKKKGETIEITDRPIRISSPFRNNNVIVIKPVDGEMNLPIQKGTNLLGPISQVKMSEKELNLLVTEISEIQFLIDNANLKEALDRIRKIRKQHKSVRRLSLLEATTLVLLGEDDTAKSILEKTLRKKPRDKKAVKLFQSLGGKIEPAKKSTN